MAISFNNKDDLRSLFTTLISFNSVTPTALQRALESAFKRSIRVRLWYGHYSGMAWTEDMDVKGTLGVTSGVHKKLILLRNATSSGGGILLDHCIVRLDCIASRKTLWQHENFTLPIFTMREGDDPEWPVEVLANAELVRAFKDEKQAQSWIDFQRGHKYSW